MGNDNNMMGEKWSWGFVPLYQPHRETAFWIPLSSS
ncbi:MAG: hypothetical protein ACI9WU_000727 [Myxococcota bacterium]|jgi:hypothetical protein